MGSGVNTIEDDSNAARGSAATSTGNGETEAHVNVSTSTEARVRRTAARCMISGACAHVNAATDVRGASGGDRALITTSQAAGRPTGAGTGTNTGSQGNAAADHAQGADGRARDTETELADANSCTAAEEASNNACRKLT